MNNINWIKKDRDEILNKFSEGGSIGAKLIKESFEGAKLVNVFCRDKGAYQGGEIAKQNELILEFNNGKMLGMANPDMNSVVYDLFYWPNVKEHAPPPMESQETATEELIGGCCVPTCCASSLSYVTLEIAGMDHPKKDKLDVIDKATNESLTEKYPIQYADSNLGYFVYLDRDTHDPKLVRNRKLEIRCPKVCSLTSIHGGFANSV